VGTDVKTVRKANTEERNRGTARLPLTTDRKVEFASRASKREVTTLRQGERRNTRQGDRAEQNRRDREAAKPTIRYCLVMLDLPSDKRRRSYITKGYEVMSLKAGSGESRRNELLEEDQSEFGKYNPSI
jgi:hypothetical protein